MRTYYAQMNTGRSAAAACSGWFCAAMALVAAIFAGIVGAVSVVFFAGDHAAVRLCIVIAVQVIVLALTASAKASARKR